MFKRLRTYLFMLAVFLPTVVFAQKNANVGVFAGTTYYLGDINPNRHVYRH